MDAAAERLLDKLRRFIATDLDGDERALLAQLLAPGVAAAHVDEEVAGFGLATWSPVRPPRSRGAPPARQGGGVEGLGLSYRDGRDGPDGLNGSAARRPGRRTNRHSGAI